MTYLVIIAVASIGISGGVVRPVIEKIEFPNFASCQAAKAELAKTRSNSLHMSVYCLNTQAK